MADLATKIQGIEERLAQVDQLLRIFASPKAHKKRRTCKTPKSRNTQPILDLVKTITALVLQCSAAIKDVKRDFQRHFNGDDGQGRVAEVDAQNAALETPTPTPESQPVMRQEFDCITSTHTEIASHRVTSIGNSNARRNTANSLLVAETPNLEARSPKLRRKELQNECFLPDLDETASSSHGTGSESVNSPESDAESLDTGRTAVSKSLDCSLSTQAPGSGTTSTSTLSIEQMGANLVQHTMRLAADESFAGIVAVENLPPIDWGNFKGSIQQPSLDHDFLGVEYFQLAVSGTVGLRVSQQRKFKFPNLSKTPDEPSRKECENYVRNLIDNPPKDPIEYYVGPSLASGLPLSKLDSLLHSGQLARLKSIPGANVIYWHVGKKGSGTGFHVEDARKWRSFNMVIGGRKLWIFIRTSHTVKFEAFVKKNWRCNDCHQFVRHQNLLISPETLKREGIAFDLICVGPGQMVVTEPEQYHAVINISDCFAISINFLPPGEAIFPPNLRICTDCGLYPLAQKEFIRVPSTKDRSVPPIDRIVSVPKRRGTDNDLQLEKGAKRIMNGDMSAPMQLQRVVTEMRSINKLYRYPSHEHGATPKIFSLATAIMSQAAAAQFHHLVTSTRELKTTSTIRLDVSEEPSSRLVQRLRRIDTSGRRSMLEKFVVRTLQVFLAKELTPEDGRQRVDSALIKNALEETGWKRDTLYYHLKQGRKWTRICGDYEGLLCFFFLEPTNPFEISADQYLSMEDNDLKIFHDLLKSDYITAICSAGKAFQGCLQSTAVDTEFVWEGKGVSAEKLSAKDLLPFPVIDNKTAHMEREPDWPRPEGWPDDWPWPCDPFWVHPDMMKCDVCQNETKCDCINLTARAMPRIKFYDRKGRGLQAVAPVPGGYAYRTDDLIGELLAELVAPEKYGQHAMEVKRPDIQAHVCQMYFGKRGNNLRLINHGCQDSNPPAEFRIMQISGRYRMMVVARRNILDGEEITAFCGSGYMKEQCLCDACLRHTPE